VSLVLNMTNREVSNGRLKLSVEAKSEINRIGLSIIAICSLL
jgi:hypothetical protein